jgi:hypothetical protein
MINFILKYSTYQTSDKKFMIYIFNIPYVVCYHLANFELKSPLVHGEIKKDKLC